MNNHGQSYIPIASAEHSLNTNRSICTSLDKYAPLIDTIRGYFVQSLETRICDGLEMLVSNEKTNLSTQFVPYVRKCLDVAGNAFKYFFKDGIVPCILNAIVINNRLNKVSYNLDEVGVDRNFLRHINIHNYIYADEYLMTCDNNSEINCNCSNNGSLSFRSSYATNNSSQYDDKIESVKNSRKATEEMQHFNSAIAQKMNRPKSSTGKSYNNLNNKSHHKSLQVVVRNREKNNIYVMIELPCNYERLIHQIKASIDSSWKIADTDELNHEFISAINNICISINKKLDQLDFVSIMRCRLYLNIQDDCICVQLKMMDVNGCKIFLYDEKIFHENKLGDKSNPGRSDEVMLGISATKKCSNAVFECVSNGVRGGANGSASPRLSFRTINEYPQTEVHSLMNSLTVINHSDNNVCDESNDYEVYEGSSDWSSENNCWSQEFECYCNSSNEESFDSRKHMLDSKLELDHKEANSTVLHKSFYNLSSSTHTNDDSQRIPEIEIFNNDESPSFSQTSNENGELVEENNAARGNRTLLRSRIFEASEEIFDISSKRISRESKKSKSVSIQTADLSENLNKQQILDYVVKYQRESLSLSISKVVSIIISNASESQEIIGLERIDETEEIDEIDQVVKAELIKIVEDIDDKQGMREIEVVETARSVEIDENEKEKQAEEDKNIEVIIMDKETEIHEMEKREVQTFEKVEKVKNDEKRVEVDVAVDLNKSGEIEKVDDFQKQEETNNFGQSREFGTQTSTRIIDESIVSISNEDPGSMKDPSTSFTRRIDWSTSTSPPPPSLKSSKHGSSTKSEEIEIELAPLLFDGNKKIRKVMTEEKLIVLLNSERRQGSSTIFISPCRHLRKSSGSLRIIKCPRKFSGSIYNRYSCSETFSDPQVFCSSLSFYATGDSSMNNLYTVYSYKGKSRLCKCKKYEKSRVKTTVRLTKNGFKYLSKRFDHYYPLIKKNTKLMMAELRKRFKIVFSRRIYYKIKRFIEEKLIKTLIERENTATKSEMSFCRMQHRRKTSSNNHSFNNFPMHTNDNNFTQRVKNYTISTAKSESHSHSLPNIYSRTRQNNLYHSGVSTNRDSELLNRHRHRRLPNFMTDDQSREMNNKSVNNAGQVCRCFCCCNSIKAINNYQSIDNSIHSVNNKCHRFSNDHKHTQYKHTKENVYHKKRECTHSFSSSLSLSSGKDYFCWYHKMFAAKNFNRYPMSSTSYICDRLISDEFEVDCGECFGPIDHHFRLMLNQYMNLCKKIQCPVINRQSINGNPSRTKSWHN